MAEEIMTSIEMERKIEQQKMISLLMFHMTSERLLPRLWVIYVY